MKRMLLFALLLCLVAGCGAQATPTPTPDAVATQVAVMQSAAATLTAHAPAPTDTQPPATASPTPSPTATLIPTSPPSTAVVIPSATLLPPPSMTPTRVPVPTQPPATLGPSLGSYVVVGVYSNDALNVRAAAGAGQPVVGTIPYYGHDVQVYAGEKQVGGAPWVPVTYGGLSGWVNRHYLARQVGDTSEMVIARASQAVLALRDHDLAELVTLVHPVKGVTFSPYTFVRSLQGAPGEADVVFSRDQLAGLWSDATVYHWGTHDGSGLPIDGTFQEYYGEFVYDVDFAQPEMVGLDEFIGQGNTINNIREVYPLGVVIEYHFSGFDPQYGGMDWRSLRLVFEEVDGNWSLVGIVHDEWTI